MREISLALGVGTVAVWLAATPVALAQQPPGAMTREQLERARPTIRAINITVDNIFDPNNPEEDKALYRWANRVHIRTRPSVIEDILLFEVGDTFVARLLDESARTLRARGFIAEAIVEPGTYDAATNSVDVNVRIRDSWSLALDLKLNHTGGVTEWGIGLSDNNLLGTGKTFEISHESEIDRDHTAIGYADDNVFGSRVQLSTSFRNASDGDRRQLLVERPFYSLDTRWSLGGNIHDEQRIDTMYDLGEEIDEFGHDIDLFTLQGGLSRGLVDQRVGRWLMGMTSEEHTFRPTLDVPVPLLLPPDRKLVYPWIGWQLIEEDFREMTELNTVGRTEDISLGLNVFASVGFARQRFDSDRDAELLRFGLAKGWEPGGAGRLLLMEIAGIHAARGRGLSQLRGAVRRSLLPPQSRSPSVLGDAERPHHPAPRPRDPGAAGRRQWAARLPDPLPSRREPHDAERRAAFLHGFLSVAAVSRGLGRVRRRGPHRRARPARHAAPRHPLRRRRGFALGLTARERPQRRTHRSRLSVERRPHDRQGAVRRRDEELVLATQNGLPSMSCAPGRALMRSNHRVTFGHRSVS